MKQYIRNSILVVVGMAVLLFLAYFGAIQNSLELQSKIEDLKDKQAQGQFIHQEISQLESRLLKLDNGQHFDADMDYSQVLLKTLNKACSQSNVSIRDFGKQYIQKSENLLSETHEVCLKGGFIPMLKIADQYENEMGMGEVSALHFDIVKNKESRENELQAKFYIRHIEKTK